MQKKRLPARRRRQPATPSEVRYQAILNDPAFIAGHHEKQAELEREFRQLAQAVFSNAFTETPKTKSTGHFARHREAWEWIQALERKETREGVFTGREGVLAWVLAFVSADLRRASPRQLVEWGERLRVIYKGEYTHPLAPMPTDRVFRIQAGIQAGLKRLFADANKGDFLGDEWILPGSPRRCLVRQNQQVRPGVKADEVGPKATRFMMRLEWGADEEGAILAGVADLLREAGARLRACPECGAFILRVKRQLRCSLKNQGRDCGQVKRNRAKQLRSQARG